MMFSLRVLLLPSIASLLCASPDVGAPLIEDAALEVAGLSTYWQASLPLAPGDSLQEAHLVDDMLYAITDGGSLFALTRDTGLLRWGAKLTEPDFTIYRPSHIREADGAGPVVIPTTSEVFIYDRFSGDLIQRFVRGFAAGSTAVAYDHMLFIGSADGRFYSLVIDLQGRLEPFKRWEVLAGGPVTAAPVLYDYDMLLFASQSGTVYSCRAPDKALNWTFRAGGPVIGDPFVDESGVYVASMDRSLYKLRLGTGRVLWRVRMPRPLDEGPIVAGQTVFQHCLGHGLSAIDVSSGREKWRKPDGRSFVAHSRNGDMILTHGRRLELTDSESGDVLYVLDAHAVTGVASNTRDAAAYLLAKDGRILCARLADVPYLRHQQVLAARGQLNSPPTRAESAMGRTRTTGAREDESAVRDPFRSRRDRRP
jgi:outer membrane protein assembly factor BamB